MSLVLENQSFTGDPQRIARLTGVLFLVTFVTSIPAVILYHPVLHDAGYIVGDGASPSYRSAARSSRCTTGRSCSDRASSSASATV